MTVTTASLSGAECAAALRAEAQEIAERAAKDGRGAPRLVVVVATEDESTAWYVRSIGRAAGKVGIGCETVTLAADSEPGTIRARLAELSADSGVHGIILQTPLPPGASAADL